MEYYRARPRRLRKTQAIRNLVADVSLHPGQCIMPYFLVPGNGIKEAIHSMPGIYHFSADTVCKDIDETLNAGVNTVLLFGVPERKDERADCAHDAHGVVQQSVQAIKREFGDSVTVMTDVCLCAYTPNGHCGIVRHGDVDNDASLEVLAHMARSHAQAGADFVAPSAMMDNQTAVIRTALDDSGFQDVGIMAYSAKYASHFYGPFRDAAQSGMQFGDRKSYQMDFRRSADALWEIQIDIGQGADIIMVKPALAYLDIICRAQQISSVPVAAYNVSGEYSMVKTYSRGNPEIEKNLALESLIAMRRAGADIIITYFAKKIHQWLS